jgi:hypothetical protein
VQKRGLTLVLLVVSLLSVGLMADVAHAGTAGAVTDLDTRTAPNGGGYSTITYTIGSRVYIYWGSVIPYGSTVDIKVYGPDGSLVTQWLNQPISASGTAALSFEVNRPGYYDITFNGQRITVWGISVFVLPESALGTLIAIVAGVAAVGTFKIVQQKKTKNKQ